MAVEWRGARAASLVEFVFGALATDPAAAPDVALRLEETAAGRLALSRDGEAVYQDDDTARFAGLLADEAARAITNGSGGGLLLHAAALGFEGRGVLVPIRGGGGKTTLAAWLTGVGVDYLTDDLAFVPEGSRRLEGFTRPLRVRDGAWAPLGSRPGGWPPPGEVHVVRDGRLVAPAALGSTTRGRQVDLDLLLFAEYDPEGDGRCVAMTPAQAALGLLRSLLNAGRLPAHGFDEAVRLARSTGAWALRYRDCARVEGALRAWAATGQPTPIREHAGGGTP